MPIRPLSGKIPGIFTKPILVNIILLTNALVWYGFAIDFLEKNVATLNLAFFPNLLIWSTHFLTLIFSALLGASLTKRIGGRTRFLIVWMILGIIAPFVSFIPNATDMSGVILLCVVFGFSFGFGMPNCMGYYTRLSSIENRGKIGGLIILFTGLSSVGLGLIFSVENILLQVSILAIWRVMGLLFFLGFKPRETTAEAKKVYSYRKLIGQRPFVLYLIPWIMFSLLNYLTTPVQTDALDGTVLANLQIIGNIFLGGSAIVGGFLMDSMGRKRMAILGFVMLGLSYSILGFFQDISIWYFHTIINGISWGILYVLFVLTVWGDLSNGVSSDKYYALGVVPFFGSKFLELIINTQIVAAIPATAIFSFTALFLFLAVLPLVYAPETLPEKTMKDRELKNYIEKAQKEVEKVQKKEVESTPQENRDAGVEFEGEDFDEILKQAEKYY